MNPPAHGFTIHIEPVGPRWRARVWRGVDQVAEVQDSTPTRLLVGLGHVLASLLTTEAESVLAHELRTMLVHGFQLPD